MVWLKAVWNFITSVFHIEMYKEKKKQKQLKKKIEELQKRDPYSQIRKVVVL